MANSKRRRKVSFRLATWNVHYGIGSDRLFDMGRIASVLAAIDADIVGLQEVGWHRRTHHKVDQFAYLREHTGYSVVEGLVRDPLRAQFGNALLTRLPLREPKWIDLKVRGHVPRAALMAEIETAAAPIRVGVAHLGLAAWERERQAQRLVDAMTQDDGTPPPSVLLGDFNMVRPRTRASLILSRRFPTCVRLPTYPVRKPILSLDRIYLSADWELTDAAVFRDGLAQQASDHLPLVAQARLIA
ncbi:MAG: endonuclease/exonuclease/phosphatase family protein [Kiloniellaceae bacterium]